MSGEAPGLWVGPPLACYCTEDEPRWCPVCARAAASDSSLLARGHVHDWVLRKSAHGTRFFSCAGCLGCRTATTEEPRGGELAWAVPREPKSVSSGPDDLDNAGEVQRLNREQLYIAATARARLQAALGLMRQDLGMLEVAGLNEATDDKYRTAYLALHAVADELGKVLDGQLHESEGAA